MTIHVGYVGAPADYLAEMGRCHHFRLALESAGMELKHASEMSYRSMDWLIAFTHGNDVLYYLNAIPKSRRVLVVLEPRIVDPRYYRSSCLSWYEHRYAMSPAWAAAIQGTAFDSPQDAFDTVDFGLDSWPRRANRAVLVNANKTSVLANERYTLRRLVIKSCDRQEIPLDVFGNGWNSPLLQRYMHWAHCTVDALRAHDASTIRSIQALSIQPKNWGGVIPEKKLVLQQARVALAIENADDYVSEKLFDGVGAGCLTIYCGPDRPSDFGIEMDDRLVCSPSASSVVEQLNWALNLPARAQAALAKQQYEDLKPIASAWEQNRTFGALGKSIVTTIMASNLLAENPDCNH